MTVKLLAEKYLEILSLKGGCTGSPESKLVKITTLLEISCRGLCNVYAPAYKILLSSHRRLRRVYAHVQSRQSIRFLHTQGNGVEEVAVQSLDSIPVGYVSMCVLRRLLRIYDCRLVKIN